MNVRCQMPPDHDPHCPWVHVDEGTIDRVHAEARDDLDRMLAHALPVVAKLGPARAAVDITSGLLAEETWTRMLLASVVGVALVRLVEHERMATPSPRTEVT